MIETTPGERRATGSSPNGTGLATSSAAVMCNQVGGLCENLISLANVEIRPQFVSDLLIVLLGTELTDCFVDCRFWDISSRD